MYRSSWFSNILKQVPRSILTWCTMLFHCWKHSQLQIFNSVLWLFMLRSFLLRLTILNEVTSMLVKGYVWIVKLKSELNTRYEYTMYNEMNLNCLSMISLLTLNTPRNVCKILTNDLGTEITIRSNKILSVWLIYYWIWFLHRFH